MCTILTNVYTSILYKSETGSGPYAHQHGEIEPYNGLLNSNQEKHTNDKCNSLANLKRIMFSERSQTQEVCLVR